MEIFNFSFTVGVTHPTMIIKYNAFHECFWKQSPHLILIPCLEASTKVLSISYFKGWRQPSSAVHHTPELIANQSKKVQLISKPISNFSSSSCLYLLGVKVGDESAFQTTYTIPIFNSLSLCPQMLAGNLLCISFEELLKHTYYTCSHWIYLLCLVV